MWHKKHKQDGYGQAEAMHADNGASCSRGIRIYSKNAALDQRPRVWITESSNPAWATAMAAPIQKLWLANWLAGKPILVRALWTSRINTDFVSSFPWESLKNGPGASLREERYAHNKWIVGSKAAAEGTVISPERKNHTVAAAHISKRLWLIPASSQTFFMPHRIENVTGRRILAGLVLEWLWRCRIPIRTSFKRGSEDVSWGSGKPKEIWRLQVAARFVFTHCLWWQSCCAKNAANWHNNYSFTGKGNVT